MPSRVYFFDPATAAYEKLAVNDQYIRLFYTHHGLPASESAKLFEAEISWRANYAQMIWILSDFEARIAQAKLVPANAHLPFDEYYRIPNSTDLAVKSEAFIAGLLESTFSMIDRMGTATATLNRKSNDRIWPGVCLDKNGGIPGADIPLQNTTRQNVVDASPQAATLNTVIRKWRHKRTHAEHYYAYGVQMDGQQPDIFFTTARRPADWAKSDNITFYLRDLLNKMHEVQNFLVWWSAKVRPMLEAELKLLELIPCSEVVPIHWTGNSGV